MKRPIGDGKRVFRGSSPFIGRRERRVIKLLNGHLNSVIEAVDGLHALISMIVEESGEEEISPNMIEARIEMVSIHESFADETYLKGLMSICDGAFFSGLREDFIKLFESMDDIADSAKDSSQILARSRLDKFLRRFYNTPEASISLFLDKVIESVKTLGRAVEALGKDADEVVKLAIRAMELEEEADDVKWKLIRLIFSHKSEMTLLTLLELKELILTLDGMADAAARSSETLITIVTKARG